MNDSIKTGGSAFPSAHIYYPNGNIKCGDQGMTLRDYFAAKAMNGFIGGAIFSNPSDQEAAANRFPNKKPSEIIAILCYEYADSMIAARGEV